jgi:hypothetical protein
MILTLSPMPSNAPAGTRVFYYGRYPFAAQESIQLQPRTWYTVEKVECSGFHTLACLLEVPGIAFDVCMFEVLAVESRNSK